MNIHIFTDVGNIIEQTINSALLSIQSGWVSELISLAQISILLYIVIFGYMVWAGKIQLPLHDLLWNLGKFAIILAFMQNTGGLLTLVNDGVNDLKGFFAGGDNSFSLLDEKLATIADMAWMVWKKASGVEESILAILKIIGLLPLLLGFTACGAMIIYTEITLKILLAVAPIFIFSLMWGFLKNSFSAWFSAILGNCLILLFTSVIFKFSAELAKLAVLDTKGFLDSTVLLIVAGLLTLSAVKWGREMALSLAKVSVDKTIGASASDKSLSNSILRSFNETFRGKK